MKKNQRAKTLVSKILIAFSTLLLSFPTQAHATIRRVNYWGNQTSYDYKLPQDAVDASSTGDTIFIYPNTDKNYPISISKRLVVLGNGYNFSPANSNVQTQTGGSALSSIIGNISLNSGSDGTVISGLNILGSAYPTGIFVYSNNNTISRCYFYAGAASNVFFEGNTSGNVVNGCYFDFGCINVNKNSTSDSTKNLTISNNIFTGKYSLFIYQKGVKFSGELSNNILGDSVLCGSIYPSITLTNASLSIKNNISYHFTLDTTNCNLSYYNNIGSGTEWPSGTGTNYNGNQQNVAAATVFSNSSGDSPDSRLKLSMGSPAIEAGLNGVDCGVFGGANPYALSGVPSTPTIYNVTGPTQPTSNTLNLTIKARSNN